MIRILDILTPAQRSAEWYRLRNKRIGASEIASMLGINPYKNCYTTILEKNVSAPPNKYIAAPLVWGQFFESVIRTHCESIHNNTIYETGSFEKFKGHAVSPDGIGIVDGDIVLYEYKTIYARKLNYGVVPNYYLTQVWAGLETFDFCKYAIYMEAMIKVAPLFAYGYNPKQYKYNFPKVFKKIEAPQCPVICWGAIAVYRARKYNDEFRPGSIAMKKLNELPRPIDFGDMYAAPDIFEALLEVYAEGEFIELDYLYQIENDIDGEFDFSRDDIYNMAALDDREFIGGFKWKMLDKNEVIVDRRDGFIAEIMPQIQLVNETSRICEGLTMAEKERVINNNVKKINELNAKSNVVGILKG